ncbi:type II secretion system protein GspL [Pseudoduganella sp. LjRoot289]|uniref:type II secretion system protein GspL n=1 Tax=Pseudoduganella sp. LjRoot289 TaxID=3342314 RepID=UPI003ECF271D
MTTLYIRYPARAATEGGAGTAPACQFALAGDGGNVMQQGASALGNLADMVAGARRVVLLLAAADVTLLHVAVPPLSHARLKAALPALVEDQILGDPDDCVLALAPLTSTQDGSTRTVAVVQRAWLEVLLKTLVAQGAQAITALPAQLCLPLPPGGAAAALAPTDAGLELTLRKGQQDGMGLTVAPQPEAALQMLRALAGDAPLTLYLPAALLPQYQALAADVPGLTLETEHWAHWLSAAKSAAPDLAAGLGATGAQSRAWQRWRWPLRLALLAVLVNVAGLNIEWLRMRREAKEMRESMTQIFRAAYPRESVILDPAAQMRRNIAAAQAGSGQVAPDEFTFIAAAFGEALAATGKRDVVASMEYRERSLVVKLKPNTADAATLQQLQAALQQRGLALAETAAGVWQIRGGKA